MNRTQDRLHQALRALDHEVEVTEEDIAHAQHRFAHRRAQRAQSRKSVTALAAAVVAVALGSAVLSQNLNDPSVEPANPDRGGDGGGIVVHSFGGDDAERPPSKLAPLTGEGMAPYPVWRAFDQDSGRFLFAGDGGAVWVLSPGHDTPVATIGCDTQCYWPTFGPGPDEVTVLEADGGWPPQTAHVYGFDGERRDAIDISGALESSGIEGIAWSPEGSKLAVSTFTGAREPDCHNIECEARVWLLDRAGGDPVLVYQQSVPVQAEANPPLLTDLAWAPDGEHLALVSSTYYPERADPPTLVTIAVESSRSKTIYTFDDCGTCNPARYGFAWSPDGTRIAVTNGADIAQLSADGTTTFELLGTGSGPLAWLDEPPE